MKVSFFKAFLVGLTISSVFGPVTVLFIQKTLKAGIRAAMSVGFASSLANAVYGFFGSCRI